MQRTILARTSMSAVVGVVLTIVACTDDSPTSVTKPGARSNAVTTSTTTAAMGKPSTSGYEIKTATLSGVVSGNSGVAEVLCSTGKRALGGGFHILGGTLIEPGDVAVYESSPRVTSGTDGWRLEAINRSSTTRDFEVWVICATMQ
jgi:hypothetical protein